MLSRTAWLVGVCGWGNMQSSANTLNDGNHYIWSLCEKNNVLFFYVKPVGKWMPFLWSFISHKTRCCYHKFCHTKCQRFYAIRCLMSQRAWIRLNKWIMIRCPFEIGDSIYLIINSYFTFQVTRFSSGTDRRHGIPQAITFHVHITQRSMYWGYPYHVLFGSKYVKCHRTIYLSCWFFKHNIGDVILHS